MKLGFLTGCLGDIPIEEKIIWAKKQGFDCIEVSCWPKVNTRDYSGTDIDVENFDEKAAERLKMILKRENIFISSLAYYDNNLHEDLKIRKSYHNHLKKVIDAAQLLDVEMVGTFIGRNMKLTINDNFKVFEEVFSEILDYAKERNVKIIIENCPMIGWNKDGFSATISYSPELWDEMFKRLPYDNFGLNFDPSHLVWLKVDYIKSLKDYKNKIFHIHAKDTEVKEDMLSYYSIFGKQINKKDEWDNGWNFGRIPGRGQINWDEFFKTLREINYGGVISIEHEDKEYEGSIEKIKEGLELGKNFLRKYI